MVDKNITGDLSLRALGLNSENSEIPPVIKSTSLPPSFKQRRLGITRGFNNEGLVKIYKSNSTASVDLLMMMTY